jgi:molybdate transport system substrate-binding protein
VTGGAGAVGGTRLALTTFALAAVVLTACGATSGTATRDEPLLVAAASDLLPAFTELGESFERRTGERVVFSFGSSGQLAQQLIEGAPMDLYASANVAFVEQVVAAGVGDPASQITYAYGRLALWSLEAGWGGWEDLEDLATDDTVTTIAIANPDHAPYGIAARQALETAGVWDRVQPRLVFGENVADTHRLAASGNADVAIIARSLALAADAGAAGAVDRPGRWVALDEQRHPPLQQDLVVIADDPRRAELAQRFIDHLRSDEGRAVMRRHGLPVPDDDPGDDPDPEG